MLTRATVPCGLPKAPLIPVCRRSAPAHDNILLIRKTWKGWTRILMWKPSLPMVLTRYLLAQIRAASRASEDSCSYSSETRWTQSGKSSTFALLRPKSKILILASIKKKACFRYQMTTEIVSVLKHFYSFFVLLTST